MGLQTFYMWTQLTVNLLTRLCRGRLQCSWPRRFGSRIISFPRDHILSKTKTANNRHARAVVYDFWQNAMWPGLYQVLRDAGKNSHCPNCAAQDHLKYIGELTITCFASNN